MAVGEFTSDADFGEVEESDDDGESEEGPLKEVVALRLFESDSQSHSLTSLKVSV
jgi:hypothetical protein|tara:strand:+ start:127 stop:291 length:165 start_codon:yes stop_codon:yes gene_type:complete